MFVKIGILAIYVLVLLSIGIYASRKSKTYSDFNLAGRSNNKWITAISTEAAAVSGWLFLGFPGAVFLLGFGVVWILIGWMGGTLINWLLISKRLRIASELYNSASLVELFEKRLNDKSGKLALASGIAIIILMIINSSAEIVACAKLISGSFGINYTLGATIGLLLVVVYTFLGGYFAVSWTNLIQGTMMFLALLIVPVGIILQLSNINIIPTDLVSQDPNYFQFLSGETSFWTIIASVTGGMGLAFMFPGLVHALTSFMAIKETKELKFSALIAIIWGAVALLGGTSIGIIGRYLMKDIRDPEQLYLALINEYFPPALVAIFAAALLAAILSSVCSYIIISAASIGANLIKDNMSQEHANKVMKWEKVAIIFISLAAYALALKGGLIFTIALFAASGLGAAFGPLVLGCIYSKNINKHGAIASIILGMATVIIWHYSGGNSYIYEIFPGWAVSVSALFIVSKVTGGPDIETLNSYNKYLEIVKKPSYNKA
jgi:sodium/proline symporter